MTRVVLHRMYYSYKAYKIANVNTLYSMANNVCSRVVNILLTRYNNSVQSTTN